MLGSSDKMFLRAPDASFASELEHQQLIPHREGMADAEDPESLTLEADLKDLKTAKPEVDLGRYVDLRKDLQNQTSFAELQSLGLPEEFLLYLKGAEQWKRSDEAAAIAFWKELLELPVEERHYRSTWAAYMLGRAETAHAREHFEEVRRFAAAGFADTLNLEEDSWGWEALIFLEHGDYAKAIDYYLNQAGLLSAVLSLRVVAARALDQASDDDLQALAENATSRKVILAFLVSNGFSSASDEKHRLRLLRWGGAVESAQVLNEEAAEHLALSAYQNGLMDEAERWIKAAPATPTAQWLQTKLHLYAGEIDQAATILRGLASNFPNSDDAVRDSLLSSLQVNLGTESDPAPAHREILADLGAVELSRRQFVPALDAFMKAEFWEDAAFVAERVLDVTELQHYVDENYPNPKTAIADQLRELLARRLMRLNRLAEARPYFTHNLDDYNALIATLTGGFDVNASAETRAQNLLAAASIVRAQGMELLATELEPDFHLHGGSYEGGMTEERRGKTEPDSLPPSFEELDRLEDSRPQLPKRFHYRFVAAELAWKAAELMPNDAAETARALCEAGSWIKYLDPPAADRFYKALVRRCRKTEIGAKADAMRWFPLLDGKGQPQ